MFRLATIQVHDTPIATYDPIADSIQELRGQILHNVVIDNKNDVIPICYKYIRYLSKYGMEDTPALLCSDEYTILMETPLEV